MPRQIHFVTGRLAEAALRKLLAELAPKVGFQYTVQVLHISVAALLTAEWIAPRLQIPTDTEEILLPGYCGGDITLLQTATGLPVARGPKDLHELPEYFGQAGRHADYGPCNIEILAEINYAPRLPLADLLAQAQQLQAEGADLIDLGSEPGKRWTDVTEAVRTLHEAGLRVSIDSFDAVEIAAATSAGAELVLSVNATNRQAATDWGVEVVAVPDVPGTLEGLDETLNFLEAHSVPFRIDPILEPIGFGFATSLARYHEVRRRYPQAPMMMGIGNLTELTDVDSAGVNVMLLGLCQELEIYSVLTTQVINWARSSVRECDIARRLVHYAVTHRCLPKRVENRLVMLRDTKVMQQGADMLQALARQLKDRNYRIFAEAGQLHVMNSKGYWQGTDPFALFAEMLAADDRLDAAHAFYLGYEMAKAVTALTLDKTYRQDEALDWGFLTRPEVGRHQRESESS